MTVRNWHIDQLAEPSALDQAVIDAAIAWADAPADDFRVDEQLADAVAARAALTPPPPVRRTWTITTEYRKPVMGAVPYEQHITSAGRFDCGNYNSPCHVIVSVEPQKFFIPAYTDPAEPLDWDQPVSVEPTP